LKHPGSSSFGRLGKLAGKNLKPYQGLKQQFFFNCPMVSGPEKT